MTKNKQDLKELSIADLSKNILDLRQEQFDIRMKKGSGEPVKTHRMREIKRSIARIKTVVHQKQTEGV
jgi:large subunit ribosomal protein L29|tara:strand:+ start:408 stop:611 length:204 start_codon:yes stop_codon:yes gene_type:complete